MEQKEKHCNKNSQKEYFIGPGFYFKLDGQMDEWMGENQSWFKELLSTVQKYNM